MKTLKQQYNDYVKLMKAISKIGKKNNRRVLGRYYAGDDTVYLSDSCCIFGIPYNIYVENSDACKCPSIEECANCTVDLKKLIIDNYTDFNSDECKMTTMSFTLNSGIIVNIYTTGKTYGTENKTEFGAVNSIYTELLELLPCAGCNPKALNRKNPLAFYSDALDTGWAICPINFDVVSELKKLGFIQK
jgi:hypothetical protein